MVVANRVRELRKAAGLSQAELAERTGVSQSAISQLETGTSTLDLEWMRRIAGVLGCCPAELLPKSDNPWLLSEPEKALLMAARAIGRQTSNES